MTRRMSSQRRLISLRLLQRSGVGLLLLALLFLAGGLLISFVRMAWQEHQINRAIERQRALNAEQLERNEELEGAAAFAESDVAAEIIARERLGMAREGDIVLLPTVVLPASPTPMPTGVPAPLDLAWDVEADSNAVRWFRALFPGRDALP